MSGSLAEGQGWEADEPGFTVGDIFSNALNGALDNTNAVASPEDVAMALSFTHPSFGAGQTFLWEIMISEDGDRIAPGAFAISHSDVDTSTVVTYSGAAIVPEPSTGLLISLGLVGLTATHRRER